MSLQKLFKTFLLTAVSLYLTTLIIPGLTIESGFSNILLATLALTLLNAFVKPLIKLLLLPINIVTLGVFRWLVNIIILFLLDFILTQVNIHSFTLSTIPVLGNILPQVTVGPFIATVLVSIVLSLTQSLLLWLIK